MKYWLVKSDPETYSFEDLVKDKKTCWDGVRNYAARNYLRAMNLHDLVFIYHSNQKELVGIAKVTQVAFQDPTTTEDWSAVELSAIQPAHPILSHDELKKMASLQSLLLFYRPRLSVMPVSDEQATFLLQKIGFSQPK